MKKITLLAAFAATALSFFSCGGDASDGGYPVTPISQSLADNVQKYAETCSGFYHGLSIVKSFSGYDGLIDMDGNEVVECKHDWIKYAGHGFFFSSGSVIDSLGNEIITYDRCKEKQNDNYINIYPEEGLISLSLNMKSGSSDCILADFKGNIIASKKGYEHFYYSPHEGLVATGDGGYIDLKGNVVLPDIDRSKNLRRKCKNFNNGLARTEEWCWDKTIVYYDYSLWHEVEKRVGERTTRDGYMDKNFEMVYNYTRDREFYGVTDKDGHEILPCKYKYIKLDDFGNFEINIKGGRSVIYDPVNKKELFSPNDYKYAMCIGDVYYAKRAEGGGALFNKQGEQLTELMSKAGHPSYNTSYKIIKLENEMSGFPNTVYYDSEGKEIANKLKLNGDVHGKLEFYYGINNF